MPRNSAGVYTLPPTNPVVPFTTIATSWANPTMSDIGNELTNSLDRNGRGGMLAPFKIFDGTLSAPGLGFLNEPSLGIYRSASGVMDFVAGGASKFQISTAEVISPTKFLVYGQQQYRKVGFKWWRVIDNDGDLTFSPSATADSQDWDVAKEFKFKSDGTAIFPPSSLPYLPLAGGTLTGALTVNANSTFNGNANVNGELGVAKTTGVPLINFFHNQTAEVQNNSIGQLVFYGKDDVAGGLDGGLIKLYATQNWVAGAHGTGMAFQVVPSNQTGRVDVLSLSASWSVLNSQILVNDTNAGSPTTGKIGFGNTTNNYLLFDGTNFSFAGAPWLTQPNNLAVGGALQYKTAQPVTVVVNIGGVTTVNFANGLAQILTMTVPGTVSFAGIPTGAILRTTFINTNHGLTITGVDWPNGVTPNFTTGPLKKAIVVIQNDGANYLGTYSVF